MAKTIIPRFTPENDFGITVKLVQPADGQRGPIPITDGAVEAFFATDKTATAAAHPSLVCTATHAGSGWWTITLGGGGTNRPTLDPILDGQPLFLIVKHPGNVRFYIVCTYASTREVTIPAV